MSRIGKQPIDVPGGVTVTASPQSVSVSGPKGNLEQAVLSGVSVEVKDNQAVVSRHNDEQVNRGNHGLMRALIANMVKGVSDGFEIKLELNGVGFRVNAQGQELKFNLGFSHEVVYTVPAGVTVTVDQNIITVSGPSKQQVGQTAAEIRALKKPEPYKGKGIKYVDEQLLRKSGKSGKEGAAA